MLRRGALVALLSAGLLAGCVNASIEPGAADLPPAAASLQNVLPADAADAIAFLDSYVMTHPYRYGNAPPMVKARADLEAALLDMGLHVERHQYQTGVNILAFKNGTVKADEWIVLSAHYDTAVNTVYGAWDDGAGTAMLLALAKAGAQSTFERTIVYAFFDEEERGLVGSAAFVRDMQERAHLAANLNFDPPGLNWPCKDAQGHLPVKIIFNQKKTDEGLRGYPELRNAVVEALNATGVPEEVRDFDSGIPIATLNGVGPKGTSDHASFDKVDVPNVFIGSAPTSRIGPAAALTYLLHTPLDTTAQMVARCGGADLMKQAFQVEIDVTLHALAALDAELALSPE